MEKILHQLSDVVNIPLFTGLQPSSWWFRSHPQYDSMMVETGKTSWHFLVFLIICHIFSWKLEKTWSMICPFHGTLIFEREKPPCHGDIVGDIFHVMELNRGYILEIYYGINIYIPSGYDKHF
jgi:hypothetical protein